MKISLSIFPIISLLLSHNANADSLRCRGQLAKIGDTKAEIVAKCGEPVMTDNYCQPIATPQTQIIQNGNNNVQNNISINTCENVDVWTYNPGSGKFWTNLHFQRGELTLIRYGGRVN